MKKLIGTAALTGAVLVFFSTAYASEIEEYPSVESEESVAAVESLEQKDRSTSWINPRFNVVNQLNGNWNGDIDVGILSWLTFGPSFTYYTAYQKGFVSYGGQTVDSYSSSSKGWGVGARANLYLSGKRFQNGWMIASYAKWAPTTISGDRRGIPIEGSFDAYTGGMMLVYQRVWKYGLNFNIGGGLAYFGGVPNSLEGTGASAGESIPTPGPHGVFPVVDLSVGIIL